MRISPVLNTPKVPVKNKCKNNTMNYPNVSISAVNAVDSALRPNFKGLFSNIKQKRKEQDIFLMNKRASEVLSKADLEKTWASYVIDTDNYELFSTIYDSNGKLVRRYLSPTRGNQSEKMLVEVMGGIKRRTRFDVESHDIISIEISKPNENNKKETYWFDYNQNLEEASIGEKETFKDGLKIDELFIFKDEKLRDYYRDVKMRDGVIKSYNKRIIAGLVNT